VIVLGQDVAAGLFEGRPVLGQTVRVGGFPYRVIGLLEKQGSLFGMSMDRLVIGPLESGLRRITNPRGDIDGMMLQASSTTAMFDGMELVRGAMRARRLLRPAQPNNFSIETSEAALEDFTEVKTVMTVAGTVLPLIGLVVGGMVIMNIMLVAVAERTYEIGIRKALGARRKDILRQFLVEAATLSTLGAVIGIGLGLGGAWMVQATTPLPAAVAPWSLVVATLLGLVVGIVSGVYPARRAARLDPIDALRQE
jgi:putative ABC transport system permease protein